MHRFPAATSLAALLLVLAGCAGSVIPQIHDDSERAPGREGPPPVAEPSLVPAALGARKVLRVCLSAPSNRLLLRRSLRLNAEPSLVAAALAAREVLRLCLGLMLSARSNRLLT